MQNPNFMDQIMMLTWANPNGRSYSPTSYHIRKAVCPYFAIGRLSAVESMVLPGPRPKPSSGGSLTTTSKYPLAAALDILIQTILYRVEQANPLYSTDWVSRIAAGAYSKAARQFDSLSWTTRLRRHLLEVLLEQHDQL